VTKEIDQLLERTGRDLRWTSMRVERVQKRFRELLTKAEDYLESQLAEKKKERKSAHP